VGKKQRDLITAVGLLLEAASYLQRAIWADVECQTGLPGTWFETLVRLQRSDSAGVRMNQMAAQVSFPPSSFSRLVDRMETDGLVERSPDPVNRRATLLRLTAQGEERIAEAIAVHEPSARARFANLLSEQELDVLESITRKLRDANRANPTASHHPNGLR
jgi:DNA-binding MarR family transcriptional regulator